MTLPDVTRLLMVLGGVLAVLSGVLILSFAVVALALDADWAAAVMAVWGLGGIGVGSYLAWKGLT